MGTFISQLHIVEGQPQAKQLAEEFFSSNSSKPFVVFRYNNNALADQVFFEVAEAKYGMGCVLELKESRKGMYNLWSHFAVISGHTQRGCQFYGDFANDLERYKEACQEVGQDCGWDNLDQIFYECTPSLQ